LISYTQRGPGGVSFGDLLIKGVVEQLLHDFPQLKVVASAKVRRTTARNGSG